MTEVLTLALLGLLNPVSTSAFDDRLGEILVLMKHKILGAGNWPTGDHMGGGVGGIDGWRGSACDGMIQLEASKLTS